MKLKAVAIKVSEGKDMGDVVNIARSQGKHINAGNDIKVLEIFASVVERNVYVALLGCSGPSVVEGGPRSDK